MTALCAKLTAGVDLKRSLKVATVDVAVRGFQTLSWFVGIHKSKQTLIARMGRSANKHGLGSSFQATNRNESRPRRPRLKGWRGSGLRSPRISRRSHRVTRIAGWLGRPLSILSPRFNWGLLQPLGCQQKDMPT